MTEIPETIESDTPTENWFKRLIRPIYDSYQKNECNAKAYELGIECCLATYFITAYGLKRRPSAFKYSMIVFAVVPLVTWPLCVMSKEEIKPREL